MNLIANIVLTNNNTSTQPYVVQLFPYPSQTGSFTIYKGDIEDIQSDNIYLFSNLEQNSLFRYENDWYKMGPDGESCSLPQAVVRLYLPQYSADTFNKSTYILNLSTYICGIDIELGSFLFERKNVLACAPIKFGGMDEYYEYIDFVIADPYSLHYSDAAQWIRNLLGKQDVVNSSLLHTCLFVVEENDNKYIKADDWAGGQNSMLIYDPEDLSLSLNYDPQNRTLNLIPSFNHLIANSLKAYIQASYGVNKVAAVMQYVVMDENDIYYEQSMIADLSLGFNEDYNNDYLASSDSGIFKFEIDTNYGSILDPRADRPSFSYAYDDSYDTIIVPYMPDKNFFDEIGNFNDLPEGLYIQASLTFFRPLAGEDNPFITVFSNKIQFTQELFSLIINNDFPTKIDLDELNMNNVFLKATNKIEQKITVVSPTDSTKNHLLQPVFYQTRDIESVNIHPAVTENISLNLDQYKSRVDRFKVQIEGIIFKEIGRTNKGIIFKIIGSMLPKETDRGMLFVLNQDDELVTTGKYNYLF